MTKAYTVVIDYVRNSILNKTYALGDKLPPERELSELLGVSRNSVREALRILDIMGVIKSHQGAGNFISDNFEKSISQTISLMYALNRVDYIQISEFRHALEFKAYMLAMQRITPKQIVTLKEYLDKIENPCSDEEKSQYDKRFHMIIVEASGNCMIIQNTIALNRVLDYFIRDMRREILRNQDGEKLLQQAHWQMVEAFDTKETAKGIEALNRHFEYIAKAIEKMKE